MSPLPWITAVIILGIVAGPPGYLVPALLVATTGLVLGTWSSRWSYRGLALSIAALGVGLALGAVVPPLVPRARGHERAGLLRGVVELGCRVESNGAQCLVRADSGERVLLSVQSGCAARPGDEIEAVATFAPLAPDVNGARAGPGSGWARRGVTARARAAVCEVGASRPGMLDRARRVGQALRDGLARGLAACGGTVAGRARALLFGDTAGVEPLEQEEFRDSGLSHLLAVSGAHVALLAGILGGLSRALAHRVAWVASRGRVELVAAACTLPAVTAFVLATGESPSSLRALGGAVLGTLCRLAGRRARAECVVAASALCMVLPKPEIALDPGWQLSVVAAWALAAAPRGNEADEDARAEKEKPHGVVRSLVALASEALGATVRVAIATAPVLAWHFQRVPCVALLANVVAAPLAEAVALPAVLLAGTVGAAWPAAGATVGRVLGPLLETLFALPHAALAAPGAASATPTPTPAQAAALVGAAIIGMRAGARGRVACALVAAGVVAALEVVHLRGAHPGGVLRVTALDVGQGDALLLDLPDGEAMLVDGGGAAGLWGEGGGLDPGERVVLPFLADHRRRHLVAVVASHPHPDHVGGLAAVLRWADVDALWDTRQGESLPPGGSYARMRAQAAARSVPVLGPEALCGPPREFHGVRVRVLAPCPRAEPATPPNDASFVIELTLGRARALLPGDLEHAGEATVLDALEPVTLLKLGHHGSRTSSSAAWLDRLRPRVGLYSAGHPSRFGHPHAETLEAFAARGIPLYGTDTFGAVSVTLRPGGDFVVRGSEGGLFGDPGP